MNCLPQSTGVEEEVPSSHYSGGPKILASFGYFISFLSEVGCLSEMIHPLSRTLYFVGVREAIGFFITIIVTDSSETSWVFLREKCHNGHTGVCFSEVVNL